MLFKIETKSERNLTDCPGLASHCTGIDRTRYSSSSRKYSRWSEADSGFEGEGSDMLGVVNTEVLLKIDSLEADSS